MPAPTLQQGLSQIDGTYIKSQFNPSLAWNDANCDGMSMAFSQPFPSAYGNSMQGMQDFGALDAQEFEFSKFIQPSATIGNVIG